MNAAARAVVTELPDITIAYGVSDEYRLGIAVFTGYALLTYRESYLASSFTSPVFSLSGERGEEICSPGLSSF